MGARPVSHDGRNDTVWFALSAIAARDTGADRWALYESLKRMYRSQVADATPEQYQAAMQRTARLAGV